MAAPTLFYDGTAQHMVFELTKASPAEDPVYSGTTDGEALTNCQIKFKLLGGAWSTVTSPTITWDATGQYWEGEVPAGVISGCGQAVVLVVSTNSVFATLKILVNVVLPPSTFTGIDTKIDTLDTVADEIKAVTDLLTADPLGAINAQMDTAISDAATADTIATPTNVAAALTTYDAPTKAEMDSAIGAITVGQSVGAEKVIPPDYYELDAENKRIKLLSPYNALTPEQVKFIKDLDENYIIYNDRETSYETLPISITTEGENTYLNYTTPAQNTITGNTIQISINM